MLQSIELTNQIKKIAANHGFDACGIAKPDVLEKEYNHLKQWIKEKKHGNMLYLEKNVDLKADPRIFFTKTKSLIALTQSYFPSQFQNDESFYKIAKYAYGNNYHWVLKEKINNFIKSILELKPDAWLKSFTDSNQLFEKAWAARCGLGWIGKNTVLINKKFGSFMFISIILTDIELEYDVTVENNCLNCEECIKACPVNALEMPYNLNASKCISYLTIENKNSETRKIKGETKGWIYGCDICQDVCPMNKSIPFAKEPLFKSNSKLLQMSKNEWEMLDEEKFLKLFNRSAIKRIGLKKIKENIKFA